MASTDDDKQRFLDAFAKSGVKSTSAIAARVAHVTVNNWLASDPAFAEAFEMAKEEAADRLHEEARRRAHDGVERTKYAKDAEGKAISYQEVTYSDTLLIFLLKGAKPDMFADRQKTELSGPAGRPIQTDDTSTAARIAAILDAARRRANDPLS